MLKLLAILFICYLFFRMAYFFIKMFFLTATGQNQRQADAHQSYRQAKRKAPGSNLDINYVPGDNKSNETKGYEGGDYVDFEELKKE